MKGESRIGVSRARLKPKKLLENQKSTRPEPLQLGRVSVSGSDARNKNLGRIQKTWRRVRCRLSKND